MSGKLTQRDRSSDGALAAPGPVREVTAASVAALSSKNG